MYKVIAFFLTSFLFFSCTKETEFSAGSDKRVTAIIDMAPESALYKFDFKSDENIGDCEDHDVAVINRYENGDLDNQYYVLQILAKDYFKSENNCEGYNSSITDEEQVQHEFSLYLYMNELTSPVKINGSDYVDHPNLVNANVVATYRLLSGENGDTNGGQGISYYGHNFSVEMWVKIKLFYNPKIKFVPTLLDERLKGANAFKLKNSIKVLSNTIRLIFYFYWVIFLKYLKFKKK